LYLPEGTIIMLDNVSFHHSKYVVEYCNHRGWSLLFTPPYSPWFNPIELCFSIIKRRYAKGDCTIDDALDALTPDHCRAFFAKSLSCRDPF
jgi:transposase